MLEKVTEVMVELREEELDTTIDLGEAMNRGPHVVMQDCPFSRAYKLFVGLGLRHLVVLGPQGRVVGESVTALEL